MATMLIGLATFAEEAEVDVATVLGWIRDGSCPSPFLIGGLPRFDVAAIDTWRQNGCPKSQPCGHRKMNAVRRGWLDDSDQRFRSDIARLAASLDAADPATRAMVESALNM